MARMRRVKLAAAWMSWTHMVATEARRRVRGTRAAAFALRYSRDRAATALELWRVEATRAASFRRRAARAVNRIRLSVVSRAMNKWIHAILEAARMRSLTAKGGAHFARCILGRMLHNWRALSMVLHRQHLLFSMARKTLHALRLRQSWWQWRQRVAAALAEARGVRRAVTAQRRRLLRGAWHPWASRVDSARANLRLARHTHDVKLAVAHRDVTRWAWTAWRAFGVEYRRLANLVSKAYAKQQRLYKHSVWNAWLAFQEEIESRREMLRRCVTSKRVVTKWFLDWYWQAFEGDISSALGLITGNCDDVIGEVYGEGRAGVDAGVFQQWQMLGQSLEALSTSKDWRASGVEGEYNGDGEEHEVGVSVARKAAAKWQHQHQHQHHESYCSTPDRAGGGGGDDSPPHTPFTPRPDSSLYNSFASPAAAGGRGVGDGDASFASVDDESFRSATARLHNISMSRSSSPGFTPFTGGYRLGGDDASVAGSDTPSSAVSEARRAWTSAALMMDDQDVE